MMFTKCSSNSISNIERTLNVFISWQSNSNTNFWLRTLEHRTSNIVRPITSSNHTSTVIVFQFKPLVTVKEENYESNQKTTSSYFHLQNDTVDQSDYYKNVHSKICLVIKRQCQHEEYFSYFKESWVFDKCSNSQMKKIHRFKMICINLVFLFDLLSTSIYDLVLIYVCHFHHHDFLLTVNQNMYFSSSLFVLSRYSCFYLGSLHPRILN